LAIGAAPANAAPPTDFAELRAAVDAANAAATDQTITLLAGTTYTLTGADCGSGYDEDDNVVGDLDILADKNVTLETPPGVPAVIAVNCASDARSRAIEFPRAGDAVFTLTLRNLVVTGGEAPTDENGGAVEVVGGNLVVDQSTFSNNEAGPGADGADDGSDGQIGGFGGAVAVAAGALTVTMSAFDGNRAGDGGAGFDGTCPDSAVQATDGGPGGAGGAVAGVLGVVSIDTSSFTNNEAGDGGDGGDGTPAVELLCEAGAGGRGGNGGVGGAVAAATTALVVTHSLFAGNAAGDGGVGGDAANGWDASTTGPGGNGNEGGIGGTGGHGGGVFSQLADAPREGRSISNSTFDANTSGNGGAGGDGGGGGAGLDTGTGIAGNGGDGGCGGRGGAVADTFTRECPTAANLVAGSLALSFVTATNNGGGGLGSAGGAGGSGDTPGAPGNPGAPAGGSLSVDDLEATALVVGTSDAAGSDCNGFVPLYVVYSFSTTADCAFGANSVHAFSEFNLAPLADNGGPTQTRLPGTGSILINYVPSAECTVADDQRLFTRPVGSGCDVGAVEVQLPPPPPPDCSVTGLVFQSTWVHQQQQQVKVVGKNPGSVPARCKVTLTARRIAPTNGPPAPKYPAAWTLKVAPGAGFVRYFQVTPPVAGTYRVQACARAINSSGVVVDGNAANDCKTANRSST
jgi:hypothetical protein